MNWLVNQVNVSSVSNREILFNNVTYLYHFIILLTIMVTQPCIVQTAYSNVLVL